MGQICFEGTEQKNSPVRFVSESGCKYGILKDFISLYINLLNISQSTEPSPLLGDLVAY